MRYRAGEEIGVEFAMNSMPIFQMIEIFCPLYEHGASRTSDRITFSPILTYDHSSDVQV